MIKHGGNVCPARARRATFLLTIPTSARDLPSEKPLPTPHFTWAPGIFFDPCPTGDLLGGALSAVRVQCNYLDV